MTITRSRFQTLAGEGNTIPLVRRLMSDQLTPVLGYRRLVSADERTAPSFLFESVEGGEAVGRHSLIGAQPEVEVVARGHEVTVTDHRRGTGYTRHEDDPLSVPRRLTHGWRVATEALERAGSLPRFTGGWVGYAGYDTVRYLEPDKLPFAAAPPDDRGLSDLSFALYRTIGVFDHVDKVLYAIHHVRPEDHDTPDDAYAAGEAALDAFVDDIETHRVPLPAAAIDLDLSASSSRSWPSNMRRAVFEDAVRRAKSYIGAGDVFQVVLSQRFERRTPADPFTIYRALRIVNPSPYMIYLQTPGAILVASSPEILCRCHGGRVTNRPLAGTRPRGASREQDAALERELRADEKERAEHVMLVDLGRNDVGRVCERASVRLDRVMDVERYSHVMHLSSTVSGELRAGLDSWDALRGTLPVGTVSGAPKVRAMQIIDELETSRRGPYAGGIGYVGLSGDMDMAIALRTLVVPTAQHTGDAWTVHIQAGAGVVADSDPAREHDETVNKAAGLHRAIDLAEATLR